MIWFQLGFKQEPWDEGHGREEAVACLGRSCLKSPSWPGSCLSVLVVDEVTAPRAGEWGQVHRKQMSWKVDRVACEIPQNISLFGQEYLINHGPSKGCSSKGTCMWDLAQALPYLLLLFCLLWSEVSCKCPVNHNLRQQKYCIWLKLQWEFQDSGCYHLYWIDSASSQNFTWAL